MNTIVKSYITRLGGHILVKRYLSRRKDHVQMNTIVKYYITRLGRSCINYKISKEQKRPCANEHNCESYNKIRAVIY